MKKTRLLLLLAAVFAVTAFTACNSESEEIVSPVSDNQLGEPIKAQFTISIPMDTKGMTRQSAATVQDAQTVASFRGIDFINLFPSNDAEISATSTLGGAISLTQILKPNQIAVSNYIPSTKLVSNNNSVLYGDVMLTTGIQSFLFYGKAIDVTANGAISTAANKFKYGTLKAEVSTTATTPANFTFSPVQIVESSTAGSTKREKIITYLNSIANAKDNTGRYWYEETETGGNAVLAALYNNFTSMEAGSSASIVDALGDLYRSVKDNAHTVAKAVRAAINNATYVTIDNSSLTLTSAISDYPGDINLPDGAAVLTYDETNHAFSYVGLDGTAPVSPLNVAKITNYVYPANLYYWVKTPIKVSDASQADNYVAEKTWTDILAGYDATATSITSSTRSVALVNPVNYGVGRLDIKVVANSTLLDDNGAVLNPDEGTTNVPLTEFKLTGILIGKQKPVDWQFNPTTTDTEYTIYDNIVAANGAGISISNSNPTAIDYQNHTLVLETAGSATECVNVALEFVYNGDGEGRDSFWGINGRIREGEKFYLLGKLDMADENTSGQAKTGNKVFKQDFKTLATFRINNLKKAYNTIPDLRNPRIELGLSVDLDWQEGVTFDQTIQ